MAKKHGKWIQHTHFLKNDEYECTNCGYIADRPYATCPSCGNDMNGSDYDPEWVDEMEIIDMIFDD